MSVYGSALSVHVVFAILVVSGGIYTHLATTLGPHARCASRAYRWHSAGTVIHSRGGSCQRGRKVSPTLIRADSTSGVAFDVDTRQPRMRRENTSVSSAT